MGKTRKVKKGHTQSRVKKTTQKDNKFLRKSLDLKKNYFLCVFRGKNVYGAFENVIFSKYYGGIPDMKCIL
jgi:hypothetical protein